MDSLEFIHRFREAQQAAGNRPVEVIIVADSFTKDISIHYDPAQGALDAPAPPCIVITYPR